jgi:hypothetical protein
MASSLNRLGKFLSLFLLLLLTQLPVYVSHFLRATLDPDIYWHLRVGEWILRHHSFPHVGLFSQAQAQPWIAYSWGFEVLMASLFRLMGLAAIPLALGALRAVIAFTIFLVMLRLSSRFWIAWLLTASSILPLASIMVIRPVLFTILFFTIEIGLIFEARRRGSLQPLYWLPLLFVIWANVHIQFVYGLFLLAIYAGCELLSRFFGGSQSWISRRPIGASGLPGKAAPALQIAVISLLSFCATFLGPYWGKLYLVIFRYAGNTSAYNEITELVALAFRDWSDYFVVILLMAACFTLGRKGVDLFTGTLIFSSAMVSFRSNRDAWFIVLVSAVLIAEGIADNAADDATAPDQTTEPEKETPSRAPSRPQNATQYAAQYDTTFYIATLVLSVVAAFGYAVHAGLGPQTLISGIDTFYPVRATGYVLDHHLPGPMYNSFDWGGFLIFNLHDYPVSIDGRNDLYGAANLERQKATLAGINWKSDPTLAHANFVLIERANPLAKLLSIDPGFKLVYADNLAVIFVRTNPLPQPDPSGIEH